MGYIIVGITTYVITPILYKDWGWGLYSGDVPPPEMVSAFWPIVALYYLAIVTYKVVSSPFVLAKYLHNKVAGYIHGYEG